MKDFLAMVGSIVLGIGAVMGLMAILLMGSGVSFMPSTESQPASDSKQPAKSKYEVGPPDAQEMLELVNAERKKVGVKPLTIDKNVQKSAQLKADDFAERDYYSHIVKGTKYTLTPEMAEYVNKSCSSSGENINGDNTSSQQAFDTWMDSKPHREAILDGKYTLTGFGVSLEDTDYFTVQHFCVAK